MVAVEIGDLSCFQIEKTFEDFYDEANPISGKKLYFFPKITPLFYCKESWYLKPDKILQPLQIRGDRPTKQV